MGRYSIWFIVCVGIAACAMEKKTNKPKSLLSFNEQNQLIINKDIFIQRFNNGLEEGPLINYMPKGALSFSVVRALAPFYVLPPEIRNHIKHAMSDTALRYLYSQTCFLPKVQYIKTQHSTNCTIAISNDGTKAFVKTMGQSLLHLNLETGKHTEDTNVFAPRVTACAMHNNTTLYGLSNGGVWSKNSEDTHEKRLILHWHRSIDSVALSDLLYAATTGNFVWLYDSKAEKRLPLFVLAMEAIEDIALSNKRLFSARQDRLILAHDPHESAKHQFIYQAKTKPQSLCVRNTKLVVGMGDGDCLYMDLRHTKRPLYTLSGKNVNFERSITAVGTTKDYDVLAGSHGGIIRWQHVFDVKKEFNELSLPEAYIVHHIGNKYKKKKTKMI